MPEPLFDAPKGMRENCNYLSRPRRRRRTVARSPNNAAPPADPARDFRVYFSEIPVRQDAVWHIWNDFITVDTPEDPIDPTSHS